MPGNKRKLTWLILAAILLLAAFLRFYQLGTLPPGLYHDEAYNGLDALSLLEGKSFPQFYEGWELYAADAHASRPAMETRFPIFFEGNYGREPLHVYLMALAISFLGASPLAVRAVPAAAGVLAVLTTFLAARALFSGLEGWHERANTIALLAAFFLAVLYPAVHFSRFGIRAMLFVPAQTLTVACFWWGVNRAQRHGGDGRVWLAFLAAGFFLGLGIYTFAAARLFPLVWLIFVPLWFWLDRAAFKAHRLHILSMAAASLLTAAPLLVFFARYPYYFVFRISYVANKGRGTVEGRPLQTWLANVGRVGRGFFWQGETHLRHNLPGRPVLDPIQAVFFIIGLARGVWRVGQVRFLFLLIWFGVMLLPSILSGDAPHFGRLVGSYAPASIFAALGALWLWDLLRSGFNRGGRADSAIWPASAVLLILLAISAGFTIRDYFGRYASHPDLARDFYLTEWQLGQEAAAADPQTRIFLAPTQEELATIYFALGDPDRLRNYGGSVNLVPAGTPGRDTLYLLRSGDPGAAEALLHYFPEAIVEEAPDGFARYRLAADVPRLRPRLEREVKHDFDDRIVLEGWTAVRRDDGLDVTLAWYVERVMESDYTAYLHLVDPDGEISSQVDVPPPGYPTSDWVPGELVIATFSLPLEGITDVEALSLRSGFYDAATLDALGEAAVLAESGAW